MPVLYEYMKGDPSVAEAPCPCPCACPCADALCS